jgi:hypothetical protein
MKPLFKNLSFYAVLLAFTVSLSSCGMLSKMFKRKTGCPSNGKNVGAEKVLSGDPDAMKSMKKAKKFKS